MTAHRRPERAEIEALYALLLPGREHAKTAAELCHALKLQATDNGKRYVRLLAEVAIDYGMAICSGDNGYWRIRDVSDIDETIRRLDAQAARMLERSRKLKAAANALLYQERLM